MKEDWRKKEDLLPRTTEGVEVAKDDRLNTGVLRE